MPFGSVFNGAYRTRIADASGLPSELTRIAHDSPAAGLDAAATLGGQGGPAGRPCPALFHARLDEATIVVAIEALVVAVRTPKDDDLTDTTLPSHFHPPTAVARTTGRDTAATSTD